MARQRSTTIMSHGTQLDVVKSSRLSSVRSLIHGMWLWIRYLQIGSDMRLLLLGMVMAMVSCLCAEEKEQHGVRCASRGTRGHVWDMLLSCAGCFTSCRIRSISLNSSKHNTLFSLASLGVTKGESQEPAESGGSSVVVKVGDLMASKGQIRC
jgi:hypothetical protein